MPLHWICVLLISGYEIEGLENIPDHGSALLVFYHGNLPLDVYYVIAKCLLYKKRTLHCVGDKFIFKMPGKEFLAINLPMLIILNIY